MDHWIAKAEAERQDGTKGIVSCRFSERDSESSSKDEIALMLMMAADRQKVRIVGPIKVETDWTKHAERDAEKAAAKHGRAMTLPGEGVV